VPTDDAPRNLDVIPAFRSQVVRADPDLPPDPPSPGPVMDPAAARQLAEAMDPKAPRPSLFGRLGIGTRRPEGDATHTPTSDTTGSSRPKTRVTDADMAKVVAGGISVVALAIAAVVKWQLRRKLRQPTTRQRDGMATPLARIVVRHGALGAVPEDLADVLEFGAALGSYVNDDPPLTSHLHDDPGPMPQTEEW